jgi:predicted dehydrogenase
MSSKKKIRVGLVGVGSWGRYGHIPALRLLPEYDIVAVSSRSMETASELAKQFGFQHAFGDFRKLVEHPDVDLVIVLSPAPQHATIVKAAIAASKDVYCEWPLTTNTTDSEEPLQLAEEAGVRHFVGLQRTVGASAVLLSDLLATRYVGDLRSVRMHVSMSGFGPVRAKSLDWTVPAANFSHVLSIYGGHFMDMLFHATEQPATLNAIVKTQFPELSVETGPKIHNETPDVVMVMGTLNNGALFQIHIEGGKLNDKGLQIEITGTNGNLEVSNERSFVTKHHDVIRGAQGEGDRWEEIEIPDQCRTIPSSDLDVSVQDLAQLYAAFARDRLTGTKSTRDFSDAVSMHRLIDAIVASSSSNQTIIFKEQA